MLVPFQLTVPPARNPEPLRMSVNAGLPTGTLTGDSVVNTTSELPGGMAPTVLLATPQPSSSASISEVTRTPPIRLYMVLSLPNVTGNFLDYMDYRARDSF